MLVMASNDSRNDTRHVVRVLVVAHVCLYREALMSVLGVSDRMEVIGAADNYQTALFQAAQWRPDVAVIDMATPDAFDIVVGLRNAVWAPKMVAFAIHEDESRIVECMEAGASAYVTCDSSTESLFAVIEGVARDELLCSPRVAATLVRRLAARAAVMPPPHDDRSLTRREQQVLRLLRDGLSNKEIAQTLNIAEATVKHHVHNLLEKLEVTNRTQVIARLSTLRPLVIFPPTRQSGL